MAAQTDAQKGKLRAYFRGVKSETKKVVWPTRKELINYTGVVIFMCLIVSFVVWLLDLGINRLLGLIVK